MAALSCKMEESNSGYSVFIADKLIGKGKPIIIVCRDTKNPRQWKGRWIVLTDEKTQCTSSSGCDLTSTGEYDLKQVCTPESMTNDMVSYAERALYEKLEAKHPALWNRIFESSNPPRFLPLDAAQGKSAIFHFFAADQKSSVDALKEFGTKCGNKELADFIQILGKCKITFNFEPS
jgi:hypothetical protein